MPELTFTAVEPDRISSSGSYYAVVGCNNRWSKTPPPQISSRAYSGKKEIVRLGLENNTLYLFHIWFTRYIHVKTMHINHTIGELLVLLIHLPFSS